MIWTDEEIDEILVCEDFDISALYVLGNGKFDLNSPETSEKIELAIKKVMNECQRKHKGAGVPMVISRNGEIVYIQPDEIEV